MRQSAMTHLRQQLDDMERRAEDAYTAMYDSPTSATGHYSLAKDYFLDAIGLAQKLGDAQAVQRLEARLAHVKAVFRSQFP
jgi:hypothetical protein